MARTRPRYRAVHHQPLNLPAVFHIERLVHAAGDFDTQVFVGRVFGNFHFVPLGELENSLKNLKKGTQIVGKRRQLKNTLEASGVGRSTILPNSLSSRANIPSASAKSFILTWGSGWVVVKSPWVSHLYFVCFVRKIFKKKNMFEYCDVNTTKIATRILHGFRCFRLVRLQFLATFDFHGAVNDAIGCQRFQSLHFHDYDLVAIKHKNTSSKIKL